MNLDPDFIPFTKINSPKITELSTKGNTTTFPEDDIGTTPDDLDLVMAVYRTSIIYERNNGQARLH